MRLPTPSSSTADVYYCWTSPASAVATRQKPLQVLSLESEGLCVIDGRSQGINGAGTRAQRHLNIPDTAEAFEQDTLKSAGSGEPERPRSWAALVYGQGAMAMHDSRDLPSLEVDRRCPVGSNPGADPSKWPGCGVAQGRLWAEAGPGRSAGSSLLPEDSPWYVTRCDKV